jgi:hypothetical protein
LTAALTLPSEAINARTSFELLAIVLWRHREARIPPPTPGASACATPLGDLAILEEDRRYLEVQVARLGAREDPVTHPSRDRQS